MDLPEAVDIELAEARYRLGRLAAGELQPLALSLLSAGYYGPAIEELAASLWATWRDVGDLLDRAMAEPGRPLPSEPEAVTGLALGLLNWPLILWTLCDHPRGSSPSPLRSVQKRSAASGAVLAPVMMPITAIAAQWILDGVGSRPVIEWWNCLWFVIPGVAGWFVSWHVTGLVLGDIMARRCERR